MTSLATVIGKGAIGSRPAAASAGRLYFSTEPKTYRDNGSSWDDVSDAGATPSGSITASGYTQSTAKLLGRTTASTGAIEEISVGSGLTFSAGSLSATGGGGGAALSILGYNAVGGTFETMTANRWYLKKVTSSGNGCILSIGVHVKSDTSNNQGNINVAVFDDNSGVPLHVIAYGHIQPTSELLTENTLGTPVARWIEMPIGCPTTAADFWIGVMRSGGTSNIQLAYDAGADQIFTGAGAWAVDAGGGLNTLSDSTRKYSMRCTLLV